MDPLNVSQFLAAYNTSGLTLSVLIARRMRQDDAIHEICGLEDQGSGTAPRRKVSRVWTEDDTEDPQGAVPPPRASPLCRAAGPGRGRSAAPRLACHKRAGK